MNVLIVEDEEAYVEALTLALEVEGIESVAAMDGRDAICLLYTSDAADDRPRV